MSSEESQQHTYHKDPKESMQVSQQGLENSGPHCQAFPIYKHLRPSVMLLLNPRAHELPVAIPSAQNFMVPATELARYRLLYCSLLVASNYS